MIINGLASAADFDIFTKTEVLKSILNAILPLRSWCWQNWEQIRCWRVPDSPFYMKSMTKERKTNKIKKKYFTPQIFSSLPCPSKAVKSERTREFSNILCHFSMVKSGCLMFRASFRCRPNLLTLLSWDRIFFPLKNDSVKNDKTSW